MRDFRGQDGLKSLEHLATHFIGPKLKAREIPQQKSEAQVSVRVLNRMTGLGMPVSVRIA